MSFVTANLYVVTSESIEKGWTPNRKRICPVLDYGFSPVVMPIYFPQHTGLETVLKGKFGISMKSGKANVFPTWYTPTSALVIIQAQRDETRSSQISLPRYREIPCPDQGKKISLRRDKGEHCPKCGEDLSNWFIKESYGSMSILGMSIIDIPTHVYQHPPYGTSCPYYPPIASEDPSNAGPRYYDRCEFTFGASKRDFDEYIVLFRPGECLRIKGAREEFILYGLDQKWYRSENFDELYEGSQYDMSRANQFIDKLEEQGAVTN